MVKEWKFTFPSSTVVKSDSLEEAIEEAIDDVYRFWALAFLLGNDPIEEI